MEEPKKVEKEVIILPIFYQIISLRGLERKIEQKLENRKKTS